MHAQKRNIVVIAHNIRSLWNIGAFFRSADAFQISHIHLTGYTAAPPRKEIGKTALGAESTISWSKDSDPIEVIKRRKREGYSIVSLELSEDSESLMEYKPEGDVCIILGHEILGVPEEMQKLSDAVVHIPMLGKKNSLNVSVAAGVAFYHFRCCC
jgi:tRNA G18 (ribose-2'-O)-methylase SpoU